METETKWLTRQEAAKYLRVSDDTLDALTENGLPYGRATKCRRLWHIDDLDEWIRHANKV